MNDGRGTEILADTLRGAAANLLYGPSKSVQLQAQAPEARNQVLQPGGMDPAYLIASKVGEAVDQEPLAN